MGEQIIISILSGLIAAIITLLGTWLLQNLSDKAGRKRDANKIVFNKVMEFNSKIDEHISKIISKISEFVELTYKHDNEMETELQQKHDKYKTCASEIKKSIDALFLVLSIYQPYVSSEFIDFFQLCQMRFKDFNEYTDMLFKKTIEFNEAEYKSKYELFTYSVIAIQSYRSAKIHELTGNKKQ